MKQLRRICAALLVTSVIIHFNPSVFAATIYDNSVNDLVTRFNPGTAEIGDEIQLAGTERFLTQFDFEYWGTNTAAPGAFAGTIQARVKFYQNNGALFNGYSSPGTVIYDSGLFNITTPTSRDTEVFSIGFGDFPGSGLFLPTSDLTWSVQFSGMDATDSLGVDLYNPPVVGFSVPNAGQQDFWQNTGGTWQLLTNSATMNFGARFFASADPVPEPAALPLAALGSCLAWVMARSARAKK